MAISRGGERIGISELVERRMHNMESAHKLQQKKGAKTRPEAQYVKFYIAISRECGSGAEQTADAISANTGFQKYDHEILDYMAEHDDVRRKLYETVDDRTMGWIESIASTLVIGPEVDEVQYFNRLSYALLAICHNQHAIVIGRAANFILPRDQGLAVRLVAPHKYRLEEYVKRTGLDLKTAMRQMTRIDHDRGNFVETHFGKYAFDPRRYDLVINVSQFSQKHVEEMIISALRAKAGKSLKLPVKTSAK